VNAGLPYALAGALGASTLGIVAARRARSGRTGYYEREVYGMTGASHRRFAAVAAGFAAAFFATATSPALGAILAVPLFALWTVAALLYLASFARGADDAD